MKEAWMYYSLYGAHQSASPIQLLSNIGYIGLVRESPPLCLLTFACLSSGNCATALLGSEDP